MKYYQCAKFKKNFMKIKFQIKEEIKHKILLNQNDKEKKNINKQ